MQAGRRPHQVTSRALQSDTVDTARPVMGEFLQRQVVFRMGSAWCDEGPGAMSERAPAIF